MIHRTKEPQNLLGLSPTGFYSSSTCAHVYTITAKGRPIVVPHEGLHEGVKYLEELPHCLFPSLIGNPIVNFTQLC